MNEKTICKNCQYVNIEDRLSWPYWHCKASEIEVLNYVEGGYTKKQGYCESLNTTGECPNYKLKEEQDE